MALPGGAAVQASDWAPLENIVSKIVKEKQPFQRLVRIIFCQNHDGSNSVRRK
jgi:hypothetical protein